MISVQAVRIKGFRSLEKMAYKRNMRVSAHRHFRAASVLYEKVGAGDQPGCKAVAGYLFGLAGELALKELMCKSRMTPLSETQRRDDPFFAHFPALKTMLKMATGRRSSELRNIAENPRLFQHWDTGMRYAPTEDIRMTWVDEWKESSSRLLKSHPPRGASGDC